MRDKREKIRRLNFERKAVREGFARDLAEARQKLAPAQLADQWKARKKGELVQLVDRAGDGLQANRKPILLAGLLTASAALLRYGLKRRRKNMREEPTLLAPIGKNRK